MPCLDLWSPRTFGETISTIVLAEERAPQAGAHIIPFAALKTVNQRWRDYPGAGVACLKHIDLAKLNTGLDLITSGLRVDSVDANGDLRVSFSSPPPLPDPTPAVEGDIEVTVTLQMSLFGDDGSAAAKGLAAAAAAEGLRSFGNIEGPDGWLEYRAGRPGGPLGADFAELLAGLLASAIPSGGYEIADIVTIHHSSPTGEA